MLVGTLRECKCLISVMLKTWVGRPLHASIRLLVAALVLLTISGLPWENPNATIRVERCHQRTTHTPYIRGFRSGLETGPQVVSPKPITPIAAGLHMRF